MKNKIVLVIGASSGVGHALSKRFAGAGAKVIVSARSASALESLQKNIKENGGECYFQPCDICSEESVQQLIDNTIQQFGRIDVAILGAAIQYVDKIDKLNVSEVDAMFQTNVVGIIRCTRYILPHMVNQRSGNIAFISSIMGEAAFPHMVSYGATKAAISCFARGLRREVAEQGIHVTLFSPGHMDTNLSAHLKDRIPHWYGKSGSLEINDVAEKMVEAIVQQKDEVIIGKQNKMLGRLIKFMPHIANNVIRKITT